MDSMINETFAPQMTHTNRCEVANAMRQVIGQVWMNMIKTEVKEIEMTGNSVFTITFNNDQVFTVEILEVK